MSDTAEKPRVRPEPPVGDASGPFWEATRRQELAYQWCPSCQAPVWYPREVCPGCLGAGLEWRTSSGRGSVYTFSNVHRPQMPNFVLPAPYTVALVELEEGYRMMTNLVGCGADDVAVGMRVKVTWEPLSDGRNLPQFEPDS
ncbi:MAG TPA: OB-fold domain-containing protein [Acidimicrobiales bacterium]|nr:OB-fold domain-containing protein [Acidimicrobiales bacterium]